VLVLFPIEQTNADEEAVERTVSIYPNWTNYMAQQYIQEYFLKGVKDKMEDNFWEVYFRIFYPSN